MDIDKHFDILNDFDISENKLNENKKNVKIN